MRLFGGISGIPARETGQGPLEKHPLRADVKDTMPSSLDLVEAKTAPTPVPGGADLPAGELALDAVAGA